VVVKFYEYRISAAAVVLASERPFRCVYIRFLVGLACAFPDRMFSASASNNVALGSDVESFSHDYQC
jgi:hypothetical protein